MKELKCEGCKGRDKIIQKLAQELDRVLSKKDRVAVLKTVFKLWRKQNYK